MRTMSAYGSIPRLADRNPALPAMGAPWDDQLRGSQPERARGTRAKTYRTHEFRASQEPEC